MLMICSKLSTFFRVTVRLFNLCIKLSIYVVCFLLIISDYSVAKDKLSHDSSNQNPADHATSFSFIVWGHPRGANDGDTPLNLDEVVELVFELKPDFVVMTGDMIQGRISNKVKQTKELIRKDWDYFDACIKKLGVPVYRLPGNHDVNNYLTRDVYFERYPRLPFSFIYNDSKFILLDSHGIDQRSNDSRKSWGHEAMPFDDNQINFIKQEILSQDNFTHIFFFMHHTTPWSESDNAWWKDIHPLIVGGKTRAVFSGDNPSYMKFAHIEQDEIHYILNNTFPSRSFEVYKKHPEWPTCGQRQLDNIEYVQVNGDKIKYRTYVVGALSKENLSWRYWDEVDKIDKSITWQRKVVNKLKETMFNRLRSIFLVFTIFGGVCFLFGILFILVLKRFKNK